MIKAAASEKYERQACCALKPGLKFSQHNCCQRISLYAREKETQTAQKRLTDRTCWVVFQMVVQFLMQFLLRFVPSIFISLTCFGLTLYSYCHTTAPTECNLYGEW